MKAAALAAGPIEGPWELPEGWRWERLGGVVDVPATKCQPDPSSDLPFVGLDSIEPQSTSVVSTVPFSTMRSAGNAFCGGQVLYSRLRPYLNKVWLADREGACSGEFIVMSPKEGLSPSYLMWLLHHRHFVSFASHAVTGDRPRIDFSTMAQYPVPVPPLETQCRIVARIDELFIELDDGEAALARAKDDLETYRKSLLKAAVTGELTADWRAANPPQETGEQLPQRILADRKARWEADPKNRGKQFKAPKPIAAHAEHDRRRWPLPSGWEWSLIGEFSFVTKLAGFEYTKHVRYADDGDLDVLKAENAGPLGFRETIYSKVRSAEVAHLTRSKLAPGNLLIVFVGAGTANVATVPAGNDFFLGPNIGMIRIETDAVDSRYLEFYLRSVQGRDMAMALAKAVAQPSLSMGTIRSIPVPVPPVEEQRELLKIIGAEQALADEVKSSNAKMLLASRHLRQSILNAAFKGELIR